MVRLRIILGALALALSCVAGSASAACIALGVVGGVNTFECSGNSAGSTVIGTVGADRFIFQDGTTGDVTLISGGGDDEVEFTSFTTAVVADFSVVGLQAVAPGLTVDFQGFTTAGSLYRLTGGTQGDTLTGATGRDRLFGLAGADALNGGLGDDDLFGGAGADTLNGGAGTDSRSDTVLADCVGDILIGIETDLCPAPVVVPTMSEWSMIWMGLLLGGVAMAFVARRRIGQV